MEVKPGYKQTAVGVIPEDWEVSSIGEMFRLINGCAFKPEDWKQSGTPIIRIQNLNDPSASFNFSQSPVPERNRVEPGDLLFAWSGTIGTSFGARVWSGPAGVLNQHIFKVLMDEQKMTLPFSLLVFARVEEDIAKQAHGFKASFVHVKKSDLVKVDLPVPSLPEQRAIAEALGDVDALLGALDRLIAKKRDLKQAAMQQLLTGQTRLPEFQGKWEWKTIDQVGLVTSGKRLPLGCSLVDHPTPHPYVRVTDMRPGTVSLSEIKYVPESVFPAIKYYRIYCEDIFISVAGSLGIVGKVPRELDGANLTENADRITKLTCSQNFLLHVLMSPLIQNTIDSIQTIGAQPKLALTRIRKFTIPHPSLPEQTAIAEVLSDMDAELAELERRRDKTRMIKQGMMQELLTGRTRLL